MLANSMKSALLQGDVAIRNVGLQSDVAEMQKQEARVKAQAALYAEARERLMKTGLNEADKKTLERLD